MSEHQPTERQQKLFEEIDELYLYCSKIYYKDFLGRISTKYDKADDNYSDIPATKDGLIILTAKLKTRYLKLFNSELARSEPDIFDSWMKTSLNKLKELSFHSEGVTKLIQENHKLKEIYEWYEFNRHEYMNFISKSLDKIDTSFSELSIQDEEDIPSFELGSVNEKLLFLHFLGLLTTLSEKTGFEISSSNMGSIVGSIIGENKNTVTRGLRFFNPHSIPKDDKNNPRKEGSLQEVQLKFSRLKLFAIATTVDAELKATKLK